MYAKDNNKGNKFLELRNDLFCRYCNKQCKNLNSLKQHEARCRSNPSHFDYINPMLISHEPWNKGLTKETDERVKKYSKSISIALRGENNYFYGKHHTDETKKHLSKTQLEHDHSNQKRHSWAKMGYYDNIWMMSTYELAYYIYMIDNNSNIKRCNDRFKYLYNGKFHYYTPDFIVDDKYIEIKGYETKKDKEKYNAVDNLNVLYYKDLKYMIEYVKDTYNVDKLEELYAVV